MACNIRLPEEMVHPVCPECGRFYGGSRYLECKTIQCDVIYYTMDREVIMRHSQFGPQTIMDKKPEKRNVPLSGTA